MEREYCVINEQAARAAKSMNSFGDYIDGSATLQYRQYVDQVYGLLRSILFDAVICRIRKIKISHF